jgi:ATP-dependent exoDNAse (exonuclease V) alpha subunit
MKKQKTGAIFHFNCRVHSRSLGANAVRIAAYVSGSRMKSNRTGRTFCYTNKKEVTHTEIILPVGANPAFKKRSALFNAIDDAETRKDAQLVREVEVALPIALSRAQQRTLVRQWVSETFTQAGICVCFAIHSKISKSGKPNPHCHILLTLREVTADGFGKKVREWNNPRLVESWRESWAAHVNAALDAAGFDIRIDHRSYKRQGLNIKPTRHLGKRYSDNKEVYEERLEYNAEVISNRASAPLASKSVLPAITSGKCPANKKTKPTKVLTPVSSGDQIFAVTNDTPSIS